MRLKTSFFKKNTTSTYDAKSMFSIKNGICLIYTIKDNLLSHSSSIPHIVFLTCSNVFIHIKAYIFSILYPN